jgi:hypothetical protein
VGLSSSSGSTDDSWKLEYEAQVRSWRAESAEAREKAERERARWEEIRARGDQSKASSQKWSDIPSDLASSYPSLSFPSPSRPTSPIHSHSHRTHPQPTTHRADDPTAQPDSQSVAPIPTSATLAIFDSNLSIQTRLGALISSLGINLLLPFVNGVMLGFGEIFAKNIVVGWLGWKLPGSGVANVGIRPTRR